jgi:hypothetical protein
MRTQIEIALNPGYLLKSNFEKAYESSREIE